MRQVINNNARQKGFGYQEPGGELLSGKELTAYVERCERVLAETRRIHARDQQPTKSAEREIVMKATITPQQAAETEATLKEIKANISRPFEDIAADAKRFDTPALHIAHGIRLGMTMKTSQELIAALQDRKLGEVEHLAAIAESRTRSASSQYIKPARDLAAAALTTPEAFRMKIRGEFGLRENDPENHSFRERLRSEAKLQAAREWDQYPAARSGEKANWIAGRAAELDGSFVGVVGNSKAVHTFCMPK